MGSPLLSTTVGVRSSARRTCFISLPQCLVSSVVPSSVHVFSITNKCGHECLVSWAGESHVTGSFKEPQVILSDKILSMNGFAVEETESVILKQVATPSPCERVCVSVSTVCDWENVILNSDVVRLELLEQLRLVSPGLKFPLWLEGGTFVEMTVLRIMPAAVCGLLMPLTYVEVVPPDDGRRSTGENRTNHSFEFSSVANSTAPQFTNPGYDASASDDKAVQASSSDSILTLLTQSVLSNLCLMNESIVSTPSPRIVKTLRVVPAPSCPLWHSQSHPLSSVVVVSRDAVIGTQFHKHSFFPAKIQLCYPTPPVPDTKNTIVKKPAVKVESRSLCVMILVLENARNSVKNVYDLDSAFSRNVMGHFALVPDHVRRVLSLPVPCLIRMETGNLRLRSDPHLIDAQPLQRLRGNEREIVSANLKLFLKSCCDLCDTLVNDGSVYSIMVRGRPVDVLLLLHGEDPLLLTRQTVDLLTVRVSEDCNSKEMLRLPRSIPVLNSDSASSSASHKFVGDATLMNNLKNSLIRRLGITPCRLTDPKFSLLLGETASGRTTLVQTVCRDLAALPWRVHCAILPLKEYIGKRAEAVEKRLLEAAYKALLLRPSLVVLDDLDVLCRAQSSDESLGASTDHHYQLVCAVQKLLYFASSKNTALKLQSDGQVGNILVLGVCVDRSSLDQRLANLDRNDLFPTSVALLPLSPASRVHALKTILLERLNSHLPSETTSLSRTECHLSHLNESKLMKITEGYKLPDLANLAVRISMAVEDKLKNHLNEQPVSQHWSSRQLRALEAPSPPGATEGRCLRPSLLHQLVSEEEVVAAACENIPLAYKDVPRKHKSDSSSLDLGGLTAARRLLQECLCWPSLYPQLFSQCPAAGVAGLLLYGPPGCGKTRLAHYMAMQANINFITVKGPELLSKYIGQSEENVRTTFSRAAARAPCLLFFDEFDALAPRRGHDSTGVTDRVVNQLLTQLDGAEGRDGVWVMAATCRPDLIDPALLRPGRLEKCIYCPLPTEEERAEILSTLSSCLELATAIDWRHIAAMTPGLSGADLQSVLTTAHINAVRELINDALDEGVVVAGRDAVLDDDVNTSPDERTANVELSPPSRHLGAGREGRGRQPDVEIKPRIGRKARSEGVDSTDLSNNENFFMNNLGGTDNSNEKKISDVQQVVLRNVNLSTRVCGRGPDSYSDEELNVPNSEGRGETTPKEKVLVSLSHLLSAAKQVKPSVSASERLKYEALNESFSRSSKSRFSDPAPGKRATLA